MELDKDAKQAPNDEARITALAKRKSHLDILSNAVSREKRQTIFSNIEYDYEVDENGTRRLPRWSLNDWDQSTTPASSAHTSQDTSASPQDTATPSSSDSIIVTPLS